MSEIPKETDFRLKCHLSTDQLSQERMSKAILMLDSRFSEIDSIHPHGGRDGGKDIKAIRDENDLYHISVGFKNIANDSTQQIDEVISKFKSEATNGHANVSKLKGFAFFTNLYLVNSHKKEIENHCSSIGLSSIIYDRERIRGILDDVNGFCIRHQYLSIKMSDEEQTSFFSKFGKDLNTLVVNNFNTVNRQLQNINFKVDALSFIGDIKAAIKLNAPISLSETFRVQLMLTKTDHLLPMKFEWCSNSHGRNSDERPNVLLTHSELNEMKSNGTSFRKDNLDSLITELDFNFTPQKYCTRMIDLDNMAGVLFCDEITSQKIDSIYLICDSYLIGNLIKVKKLFHGKE
jgi:hypothetical protein